MRLLPVLPVVVALAVVAVLRPDLLTGFGGSWRAWFVVMAVALAGTATRLVVRRRSVALAPWASSAVVLALLAALLLPSFQERTVVEAFPPIAEGPIAGGPIAGGPIARTPEATPEHPSSATGPVTRAAPPAPRPSTVTAVRLASGRFHGIGHAASGRGSLYEVSGAVVLRFESIDFQGTPKPSVHLVRRGSRSPGGGLRLGALKGEHGSFSYPAPAGFDPSTGWTVLVWCDTYATPIAAADLT